MSGLAAAGPRLCTACGHRHGGNHYGICLVSTHGELCPCNVVVSAEPRPLRAARPQRSPPLARRPWYRWRFLHFETRTEIVMLPTLVLAKRRM